MSGRIDAACSARGQHPVLPDTCSPAVMAAVNLPDTCRCVPLAYGSAAGRDVNRMYPASATAVSQSPAGRTEVQQGLPAEQHHACQRPFRNMPEHARGATREKRVSTVISPRPPGERARTCRNELSRYSLLGALPESQRHLPAPVSPRVLFYMRRSELKCCHRGG